MISRISRLLLIGTLVLGSFSAFLICPLLALLLAIPLGRAVQRNRRQRLTAFGTQRWAGESDLDLHATGLGIGRLSVPRRSMLAVFNPRIPAMDACEAFVGKRQGPLVCLPKVIHTAIFAPTGVGKGVSFVIPHGLRCPDSTVFVDVKGEIATAVAEFRRKRFRHRIVLLDPFHAVTNNPDRFNPLDCIDGNSELAIDDCRTLAEALVVRTGQEREPHWCDAAEMLIGGIMSFVVQHAPRHDRSLQTVRELLASPEELMASVQVMQKSPAWNGMLARMGNQMTHFRDKELSSTLTTTGRFLRFLDTLAIADSTTSSTFDLAELLRGKMSVFLILPPEHIRTQSQMLRLWIGSFVRAVVRAGVQGDRRVHLVLDEAGTALGHMDCLDDALTIGRGYGLRIQWYLQSMAQLKKCFPDGQDGNLLGNTTQVFFGVQDYPTAEYISSRLGEETIVVDSGGTGRGWSRQTAEYGGRGSTSNSSNSSSNWQQSARKLLKPEEVLALDQRVAITFTPGVPPIWTTLDRYYEAKSARGRWAQIKMFFRCLCLFLMALGSVLVVFEQMKIHHFGR